MSHHSDRLLVLVPNEGFRDGTAPTPQRLVSGEYLPSTPFGLEDIVTAGSENELQAAVVGAPTFVDLPILIRQSNYFQNLVRRSQAGESPKRVISELEQLVGDDSTAVWENSWVRFPLRLLTSFAHDVLQKDLRADKRDANGSFRSDLRTFVYQSHGEEWVRIPVSYLLRLALAHAISDEVAPWYLRDIGTPLLDHFLNDNSSPETVSLYVTPLRPALGMGKAIARETSRRFLLTQLLVMYGNACLELATSGQRATVYFAPHAPQRQKRLNSLISDAFYRELFMNPCLVGWDRGEDKHRYMHLCHEVLSRSQLNAVIKLKDAGIIQRNLVVLPSTSNISLANNGTHLSLGSRVLTAALKEKRPRFTAVHEKCLGDLAIKIMEHFLPLFVGTYSAAPYRLDFWDFHPEKALGFLPHELDFTHLRMLWRRWKKKASLSFFGHPVTPVGPVWLDKALGALFGLKGDYVPDYRLLDYLVALLSTDQNPSLDGTLENEERLKRDLAQLGVFHESMSLYALLKLRACRVMGFCGFEGRHYSLFESILTDMGEAADLQMLLTALAFHYIQTGIVTHQDIPDDPTTESERRQLIFAASIGIQTCNIRRGTPNAFMARVLGLTRRTRNSRRYPGYWRVRLDDYAAAAVLLIERDAPHLIDGFGLRETLARLRLRLSEPETSAVSGRLTAAILRQLGAGSALQVSGQEFNQAAETYYRETLRVRHLEEALEQLQTDLEGIDRSDERGDRVIRARLTQVIGRREAGSFLESIRPGLLNGDLSAAALRQCIHVLLLIIQRDRREATASISF